MWQRLLQEKDAEIARLKAEIAWLKSGAGPAPEPEPEPGYHDVVGRMKNKVDRVANREQLELLQTDSESDSDDDALFEDAQSLFSSIPEEYSDEEEMRPRADSFRGGPKPRLDGGGGAEAIGSPIQEEGGAEWMGPSDAVRVGMGDCGCEAPTLSPGLNSNPNPSAETAGLCSRNCRKVPRRELAHMEPNTACDGWAEHWNLRVGPNYKKTGAKAPSAPQLYEFAGCENYVTADPCDNICSKIR